MIKLKPLNYYMIKIINERVQTKLKCCQMLLTYSFVYYFQLLVKLVFSRSLVLGPHLLRVLFVRDLTCLFCFAFKNSFFRC